jgi:hypothetical protein
MSDRDSDAIDEELTAYLDGELSAEDSAALEGRLVGQESLRMRLAELRRAYDLLDELPEVSHSKSFTQTTIEMVVADVKRSGVTAVTPTESLAGKFPIGKWLERWFSMPYAWGLLALAVAFGVGLGVTASRLEGRRELGRLDLASNMPGLYDAGEIAVIEELARDRELIEYLQQHFRDVLIPMVPRSYDERRSWVRSLNSIQMAKLDGARELVGKYPPEVRERLEAVQEQIDLQSNAEDLNLAARMVGVVLDTMPTSKRRVLEELKTAPRIRFIQEQLSFRAAIFYAADLQGTDAEVLDEWSKTMLLPSIMANMPFLRRETDVKSALMTLNSARPVEEGFRLDNQDALISDLAGRLSSFPRRLLESIDQSDQLLVISTWMIPEGVNSTSRLLEIYERQRRETQDEIDLLDPKEIRRVLRERSRRPGNTNRSNR